MSENLLVGSHKGTNKKWSKGFDGVRKSCGCMLGKKCQCEENKAGQK